MDMEDGESKVTTVTGVDLASLPFTVEQIKEAIFQCELQIMQIGMEPGKETLGLPDTEAMLQQFAAMTSGLNPQMAPMHHTPANM